MDNELFKQKLSEVAEWKIPETPRETSLNAKKKRGRKSAEDEYMELREEIFHEEFSGVNTTYAPMLTRVRQCAVDCEDCGEHCPNGRQKEAKLHEKNGKQIWRQKCLTCGKYQNPFTGEFDLGGQAGSYVWTDFLRSRKNAYKTQKNQQREESPVVIRSYPDTEEPL